MATNASIVELNTNNITMETKDIKPYTAFPKTFAGALPLPQAVLIPLVKAHQPPQGVSVFIEPVMDINPWPTEPAEEEPAQPMVIHNSFTFNMPKKKAQAIKRELRRQTEVKLPRKLKKACKHIRVETPVVVAKRPGEDKHKIFAGLCMFTINGYPQTKWVLKAFGMIEPRSYRRDGPDRSRRL